MPLRLRELGVGARLGVTGLLLTLLIGLAASGAHLYWHYQNRDERPGLTLDDIRAAYRGIEAPSLLVGALERGHPDGLDADSRAALLGWLRSGAISEAYDSLDLGPDAPAERIAASCLTCHSRSAAGADPKAKAIPLDTWDDVKKVAFARSVSPNPVKVIAASTHAHALSLGALSLVLAILACASSLPRALSGILIGLTGLALLADVSSWWLARESDAFVRVIAGAGFLYNAGTALLILLVLADLWRPGKPRATP